MTTKAKSKSTGLLTRLVSNSEIVNEALRAYSGQKKAAGSRMMIQCPFHDDKTPSLGVVTSPDLDVPVGVFKCLGCGMKGGWNVLAEKIGAPTIKSWNNKERSIAGEPTEADDIALLGRASDQQSVTKPRRGLSSSDVSSDVEEISARSDRSVVMNSSAFKNLPDRAGLLALLEREQLVDAQPWPRSLEWRSYSGDFLNALGRGVCWIVGDKGRDGGISAFFVVWVNGKVRGGVKAFYSKQEGRMSYLTTKGAWIQKTGLLFFDLARSMIEQHREGRSFVVLVEGPRDALRLLSLGIPAIACLGALTFSKEKALLVLSMVDQIYVMTDNDKAGSAMWRQVDRITAYALDPEQELTARRRLDARRKRALAEGKKGEDGLTLEDLDYEPAPGNIVRRVKLPVRYDDEGKLIKVDPHSASKKTINKFMEYLDDTHGTRWHKSRFWTAPS